MQRGEKRNRKCFKEFWWVPTYEYVCEKCGKKFEYFQSMSEAPKKKCEACGGKLKRLVGSGAGLIFKGGGFYATDYKKSDGGEKKAAESKPAEKKIETTESKPAATESKPSKTTE